MRITKREHSCLIVETDAGSLVIDPGNFTAPLVDVDGVRAIVFTHEHADHAASEQVHRLLDRNAAMPMYGTAGTAAALPDFDVQVVAPGDEVDANGFRLRFANGDHAVIHQSIPPVHNVGVLVDDLLYHPGDSLWVPDFATPVLAAPIGAPWLKIGEVMDWLLAVAPPKAFGIHEMVLSTAAKQLHASRAKWAVEQGGGEWLELQPGDAAEV